jgi:hypothetical protein
VLWRVTGFGSNQEGPYSHVLDLVRAPSGILPFQNNRHMHDRSFLLCTDNTNSNSLLLLLLLQAHRAARGLPCDAC